MSKLNQPTHVFPCLSRKYIWKSLRPFWFHPLCSCAGRGGAGKFDLGFPSQCRIIIVVWSEEKTANNSLRFPLWVEKKTFLSYSGWRFLSFMAKNNKPLWSYQWIGSAKAPIMCDKIRLRKVRVQPWETDGWWPLRETQQKVSHVNHPPNVRNILGSSSVCYSVFVSFCLNNKTT